MNNLIAQAKRGAALRRLERVLVLLANPSNWTQSFTAQRTDRSSQLNPNDPAATCWCLGGALMRACTEIGGRTCRALHFRLENACECEPAWQALARHLHCWPRGIPTWNDQPERTHHQVMAAVNAVITDLKGAG